MKKILFLINSLGGGGAEKVLVNLVNNMDYSKFDITVETMFGDGINFELLNKNIRYISKKAPCPRGIAYIFRLFSSKRLYKYFIGNEHYDILVAYMHGAPVKVIAGCPDKSVKTYAWLHNGNPETGTFFKFWNSKKSAFEDYKKCDAIVGVSESVSNAFANYTGIKDKTCTVHNTNDVNKIMSLADKENPIEKNHQYEFVSVGRVSNEKGFDRLYSVCKKLRDENYDIGVTIVGTGNQIESMKSEISNDNNSNWFRFAGFQNNPYKFVENSDLFVCSSRTEGLSTAVTEAIILGKPCVSTDVSGAKEILGENNEYGIVIENSEDGIYTGIKQMLSGDNLKYYAEKAKERASFFATEKTVKEAENLFLKLNS